MSKNKGSSFEREFCRDLSLYWSDQQRDDLYWRTASSGGRATVRGRQNKKTAGSYGDICALDPIGQPFLDCFVLELKRGYPKATIHDLLDKPKTAKKQIYEQWVEQAETSQKHSGSLYWCIVHKRDRRETLVVLPGNIPFDFVHDCEITGRFIVMKLSNFFKQMQPHLIHRILGNARKNNPTKLPKASGSDS